MILKLPPKDGRRVTANRKKAGGAGSLREVDTGRLDVLDTGVAALDRVAGAWRRLRGQSPMPSSDRLYISDLVAEMTYLVIGYRVAEAYRVEFQGAAVRAMLGQDLVGTVPTARDTNPGIAWIARNFAAIRALGAPMLDGFNGPTGPQTGVFLPYGDEFGRVSVILSAIAIPEAGEGIVPLAGPDGGVGGRDPAAGNTGACVTPSDRVVPFFRARRRPASGS